MSPKWKLSPAGHAYYSQSGPGTGEKIGHCAKCPATVKEADLDPGLLILTLEALDGRAGPCIDMSDGSHEP